jgi:hypothetical protein
MIQRTDDEWLDWAAKLHDPKWDSWAGIDTVPAAEVPRLIREARAELIAEFKAWLMAKKVRFPMEGQSELWATAGQVDGAFKP